MLKDRPQMATAIVALRDCRGETQEKFSRQVGVTLPTVGRWEVGDRRPGPMSLVRLMNLAKAQGRDDLVLIFDEAFAARMGISWQDFWNEVKAASQ